MNLENVKCVMVIDEDLPVGLIANTSAIMGITLGKQMPDAVGKEVTDKDGNSHLGIITFPVPILKAGKERIKEIRKRLYQPEFSHMTVVDFSDVAQGCNVYEEYILKAAAASEKDITYMGIGLCGTIKLVNKLTGNLPLLR